LGDGIEGGLGQGAEVEPSGQALHFKSPSQALAGVLR